MKKPLKPSVIDYPELRAQKARLDLQYEDFIKHLGTSPQTVAAFLRGDESLNVKTIITLAAFLGLKPKITFLPIEQEAGQLDRSTTNERTNQ